jgi:hypothetical protein
MAVSRLLPVVVAAVVASGCAHMATLRPAPKGELEVDLSLGGPMLKLGGAPIPAPLSAIGVRYGVHDRADVQLHFHPTAAVLGVLGLDVGSSLLVVRGEGALPDVTATGRFFGFTDFKEFRPYLQLGGVASWRILNRIAPYIGFDGLIQFGAAPLVAVAAGLQGIFGRFTAQLEAKWFGIGHDTRFMVVDWVSPGSGAIGIMLGFGYRFDVEGADKPPLPPVQPVPQEKPMPVETKVEPPPASEPAPAPAPTETSPAEGTK